MNRPYITLKHVIMEAISYLLYVASIAYSAYFAVTVKGEAPVHFNMSGNADRYGSPAAIMILPIVMLIVAAFMSLTIHFLPPTMFNLPFKVKPERALKVYEDTATMMCFVMLEFGIFTVVYTLLVSINGTLPSIVPIGMVIVLFATAIIMLIKAWLDNR